jgi:putative chitinase
MNFTQVELKEVAPSISPTALSVYPALLSELMPKYEINTADRVQCFLAQLAHESGCFRFTREIALGNAYEGRRDLGNTHPGDGVRYKGRGLIQITGRNNYQACSKALFGNDRLLEEPQLLEQPRYATESACWFWKSRGLNEIADKEDSWVITVRQGTPRQATYNKFQYITYRINGGQNGYKERLAFYNRARQFISIAVFAE